MDTFEGDDEMPSSENKYVFVKSNPVDLADPTGHLFGDVGTELGQELGKRFAALSPARDWDIQIRQILSLLSPPQPCTIWVSCSQRPDLVDYGPAKEVYEIKPDSQGQFWVGIGQLQGYTYLLNSQDPAKGWHNGTTYNPPGQLSLPKTGALVEIYPPINGVILYRRLNQGGLSNFKNVGVALSAAGIDLLIDLAPLAAFAAAF
jgi:hypothetical protein